MALKVLNRRATETDLDLGTVDEFRNTEGRLARQKAQKQSLWRLPVSLLSVAFVLLVDGQ